MGGCHKIWRRRAAALTVWILAAMTALAAVALAAETSLQSAIADVAKRYPNVPRLSSDELSRVMDAPDVALFDVRSQAEYDVSHLKGAVRIAPDITADAFATQFGPAVAGKRVVFYCSVGARSSRLADRLAEKLKALQAARVHNLSGGIFGWHNEVRPVVNASGPTELVHSYDNKWGRLLDRKDLTRPAPAP